MNVQNQAAADSRTRVKRDRKQPPLSAVRCPSILYRADEENTTSFCQRSLVFCVKDGSKRLCTDNTDSRCASVL